MMMEEAIRVAGLARECSARTTITIDGEIYVLASAEISERFAAADRELELLQEKLRDAINELDESKRELAIALDHVYDAEACTKETRLALRKAYADLTPVMDNLRWA